MNQTCGNLNVLATSTQLKRSSAGFRDRAPSSRSFEFTYSFSCSVRKRAWEGERGMIKKEKMPNRKVKIPSCQSSQFCQTRSHTEKTYKNEDPSPTWFSGKTIHFYYGCSEEARECTWKWGRRKESRNTITKSFSQQADTQRTVKRTEFAVAGEDKKTKGIEQDPERRHLRVPLRLVPSVDMTKPSYLLEIQGRNDKPGGQYSCEPGLEYNIFRRR